jgi:hypothetical protein
MGLHSVLLAAALLLPAANADDDPAQVVEKSVRSLVTAYDQGDVEQVKRMMTEDHETTLTYARFSIGTISSRFSRTSRLSITRSRACM